MQNGSDKKKETVGQLSSFPFHSSHDNLFSLNTFGLDFRIVYLVQIDADTLSIK